MKIYFDLTEIKLLIRWIPSHGLAKAGRPVKTYIQ